MQGRQRKEEHDAKPNLSGRNDLDPQETSDWLDSLDSVIANEGYERAHFPLEALFDKARRTGGKAPFSPNTAYLNTIPAHLEAKSPGDHEIEHKLRSYVRWNAAMMVCCAAARRISNSAATSRRSPPPPRSTTSASITSGMQPSANHGGGDLVYVQGHSAPGVYARAFMLGRLTQDQMDNFRQEVDGIFRYPHPWLMPDFCNCPRYRWVLVR